MNILAFIFAMEVGLVPSGGFLMYERQPQVFEYDGNYYYPVNVQQVQLNPTAYMDLSAEVELLEFLFIGGGVRVPVEWQGGNGSFNPLATYYDFRAGMRWKGVRLMYRHACYHPQMTYAYDYIASSGWEGAYDELSLRFEGKVPLWESK